VGERGWGQVGRGEGVGASGWGRGGRGEGVVLNGYKHLATSAQRLSTQGAEVP
jgi:hypothetical protein